MSPKEYRIVIFLFCSSSVEMIGMRDERRKIKHMEITKDKPSCTHKHRPLLSQADHYLAGDWSVTGRDPALERQEMKPWFSLSAPQGTAGSEEGVLLYNKDNVLQDTPTVRKPAHFLSLQSRCSPIGHFNMQLTVCPCRKNKHWINKIFKRAFPLTSLADIGPKTDSVGLKGAMLVHFLIMRFHGFILLIWAGSLSCKIEMRTVTWIYWPRTATWSESRSDWSSSLVH